MSARRLLQVIYALQAEGAESLEKLDESLAPPPPINAAEEQAKRRALIAMYGGAVA